MEISPASKTLDGPDSATDVVDQDEFHDALCANCSTPLIASHCHNCGQAAHIHSSLSAIFHEFVHGVMHFEGQFWNSLPLLAWKPGELTRRYINGERKRFMSPIALFLLAVFCTYAIFSIGGSHVHENTIIEKNVNETTVQEAGQDIERATVNLDTGNRQLNAAIEQIKKNPQLVFYKVQANAYKFAWALIPLSLPFLWLLFPFSRRFRLYDHFVFVTYSISFALLLSVIARLFALTPLASVGIYGALLYFPIHMFRQLQGSYGLGVGGALWRTILLSVISLIVAMGFLAGLLILGISTLE